MEQRKYTALYKKQKGWYTAWVAELPGVNTQGKTLAEARENLHDAADLLLSYLYERNKARGLRREEFQVMVPA